MSSRTVQIINNNSNNNVIKSSNNKNRKRHSKKSSSVNHHYHDSSSSSSSEDDTPSTPPLHYQKALSFNNKRSQHKHIDQVYAGPTFNNAPAPSALPIPAFSARGSPIQQPLYHYPSYETSINEIQRGLRSMLKIQS